jgi:signal transduction histidine kinase/DNA-binding response OmpR family regulator
MVRTCTLLIVDDCAEDREVCRRYLQKDPHQSYRILEADSAEGGLTLCQEKPCDAILLDFCLPTMNGLEFLSELKQRQLKSAVPVILLTGHGAEDVAVQAMKMGVQDYLSKQQLNPDVLQVTVRNVIQQWRSQRRLHQAEQRQHLIHTIALHMRQSLNCDQILHRAATEIQQFLTCDRVAIYQANYKAGDFAVLAGWVKRTEVGLQLDNDPLEWVGYLSEQQLPSQLSSQLVGPPARLQPSFANRKSNKLDNHLPPSHLPPNHLIDLHSNGSTWQGTMTPTQLLLPIQSSEDRSAPWWGVLVAQHHTAVHPWQSEDVGVLKEIVHQLALALQQAEQFHQMQAAVEQAKQTLAFKSQMVSMVSHEYRNPLTAILAAASTLKMRHDQLELDQQQHFLGTIEDKARFMARLVEDLLVLEKLELGRMRFKPLPFNVLEFVADIVEEQRLLAGDQYKILFQISGNAKGFWGDRDLLRQILVNLLTNAVKYSPQGGKITLHLNGESSQLIFSVQDQGIGIPLADQEFLFQSFKRGSNVETIPGTGLGLAITKACVEIHGGEIALESIEDLGTTVTVILPKRQ